LRFAGRAEDNVRGIFDGFHRFQGEFGNSQLIGALEFFEKTHSAQMPAIDLRQGKCTTVIAKNGTYLFYHICFSNPIVGHDSSGTIHAVNGPSGIVLSDP
jgi:hypothetical protein